MVQYLDLDLHLIVSSGGGFKVILYHIMMKGLKGRKEGRKEGRYLGIFGFDGISCSLYNNTFLFLFIFGDTNACTVPNQVYRQPVKNTSSSISHKTNL